MLSLPHTPQALVVMKVLFAGAMVTSGRGVTAATFSSHILISVRSSSAASRPSVYKNPAARSISSPGVRMVTVSGTSPIRISSGSSTASRSARCSMPASAPSRTRNTRRRAVLPPICPG